MDYAASGFDDGFEGLEPVRGKLGRTGTAAGSTKSNQSLGTRATYTGLP